MVILGGGSPRSMLVYGLVMIAILAFSYFVIIKPITDSTNSTVNHAFHQANQIQKQVNHQVDKSLKAADNAAKGSGQ
jgi:hypothetical protein